MGQNIGEMQRAKYILIIPTVLNMKTLTRDGNAPFVVAEVHGVLVHLGK
jgi:hypothetical protein